MKTYRIVKLRTEYVFTIEKRFVGLANDLDKQVSKQIVKHV